uniref:Uncharacterized protein n=1 Tax=Periophthalmus magnuspinnatus TaxID=409849 RepID=A0A3B4B782_9GOBI
MRKLKEISQDNRKKIVDLHKCLKVSCSSNQTIIHKYKHHGNVQPSSHSGRRWVLCPRDERALPLLQKKHRNKDLIFWRQKLKLNFLAIKSKCFMT